MNLTRQVNADNDCGVLMGNWSSCYESGTSPAAWCGSGEILRQFHKTVGKPVKYGQSVAFAGVTTTRKSLWKMKEMLYVKTVSWFNAFLYFSLLR